MKELKTVAEKSISVVNTEGVTVETVVLPPSIFGIEPNEHALYEAVKVYLGNQRQGTASTKGRSEVRGGGAKPWRQKGTGRARAGTIRSPLWVGGGVVFGPKPKTRRYALPKKVNRLARKSALSLRAKEDRIVVIEDVTMSEPKTRVMVSLLHTLGLHDKKVLFLTATADETVLKSCRNIPNLTVKPARDVPAYDVLNCEAVLMTRSALAQIGEALGR